MFQLAEQQADESVLSEGESIELMEQEYLALPFVLPDDGYSMDTCAIPHLQPIEKKPSEAQ
jgi:hypothetical protein